jgi:Tol biopolymer transport system component
MRGIAVLALALATAVAASAAERESVGIVFLNNGGVYGLRPGDGGPSLVHGNSCVRSGGQPCPVVKTLSWSPDGSRLAFTRGTELHLFDSRDGSERRLLTGVPVASISPPAWSPRGNELVFASVDVDTGAAEALASGSQSTATTQTYADLYAIDVESGSVRRLTTGRQTTDPAWAPGPQIVYSSLQQGRWELFIIDPDGTHRRLTDGRTDVNRLPSWSPDGTRIAFLRDLGGLPSRLNVIRPDGGGLEQISNLPIDVVFGAKPAWSPDGSMLAVSTSLNSPVDVLTGHKPGRDLYLVAAGGSGQTRITQSGERGVSDRAPTWSPDGSQLAFESFDRDRISESALYVVNADGKCERRLATVDAWWPVWQPLLGSALAPQDCFDLAVLAYGSKKHGRGVRLTLRMLNDGTRPLTGISLKAGASKARVLSAFSQHARCSVPRGKLVCRAVSIRMGGSIDIHLSVESKVRKRGRRFVAPTVRFLATTRSAEVSTANNRLTTDFSGTRCATGASSAVLIEAAEGDSGVCG